MSESPKEDRIPRLGLNKAGLRVVAVSSVVVAVSLVAALLAQGGLFTADPGLPSHPDGLTTLALVLAILAFLIQIFVFLFQTQASTASERRGEGINAETHAVLSKIEAKSDATQQVLIVHFKQLLDYVIDGRPVRDAEEQDEIVEEEGEGDQPEDPSRPVTAGDLQRLLNETLRARPRPSFEFAAKPGPSKEDRRMISYLQEWPSREEVESAVPDLVKLPPLMLVALTRYAIVEINQRLEGRRIGLRKRGERPPASQGLLEAGLLRDDGDRTLLTDRGRELARILQIGKPNAQKPDWYDEVTSPLLKTA